MRRRRRPILATRSILLLPPPALAGCLFGAILRDTRGATLTDEQRLNYFPASPLVSMTLVLDGELRMAPATEGLRGAMAAPVQPRAFVVHPQTSPTMSWSEGPVLAVTLGLYPDAWARLNGVCDLARLLARGFTAECLEQAAWRDFCSELASHWQGVRGGGPQPSLGGRVEDWTRALLARAALSGTGRGVRAIERRTRRWTGSNRSTLEFFSGFENLHRIAKRSPGSSPAAIAAEAGFADQSHMGRAVRRGTGFSPARLNRLIAREEAFWCYRLLGERF